MSIPSSTSANSNSETSPSPQPDGALLQTTPTSMHPQGQSIPSINSNAPAQPPKRSSRRANTAERRATHNAVERARRETLNSRFLDLAAMLPNLAAVRRPSKSAIVNSSIALIHNQQRSRIIGARELRLLNAEANALRQELNEWRARNAVPLVEEPLRSADFATLLAVEDIEMGEEMILSGRRSFEDGMQDEDDYIGDEGDDAGELISETAHFGVGLRAPLQYQQQQQQQAQQQQQQQAQAQQQQAQYAAAQQQQQLFEQQKVAMARAHHAQMAQAQAQLRYSPPAAAAAVHHQHSQSQPVNLFNEALFPTDMYPNAPAANVNASVNATASPWPQKAIATAAANALATPPGSAHGHPSKQQSQSQSYANTANSAFLGSHTGLSGMFKPSYGSVSEDDSDGSSHYSGVENLNVNVNAAVDQTFSFGLSSNVPYGLGVNMGYMYPPVNALPPSPPHTSSPSGSNPQSRRPSVNIHHGQQHGSNNGSPSPMSAHSYGIGLLI